MALRAVKKSTKIGPGAPKGRFCRSGPSARGPFLGRRVPGVASRARTSGEKTTEEQLVEGLARHGPLARRI